MDGQDRVLSVLGPGEDGFQLEGLELLPDALQAFLDLRGHALVAGLGGHLPEQPGVLGASRDLLEGAEGLGEVRALLHEGLRLAAVLPEGRGGHLGVDLVEPALLGGDVKDAPGGRPDACPAPPRRA